MRRIASVPTRARGAGTIHARIVTAMKERGTTGGARDLFPELRERLLASRPVMWAKHPNLTDEKGKPQQVPSFGPPTFRNIIDPKTGAHV